MKHIYNMIYSSAFCMLFITACLLCIFSEGASYGLTPKKGLGPRDSTGVPYGVLRGGDDRSDICWDRLLLIGIFILMSNDI